MVGSKETGEKQRQKKNAAVAAKKMKRQGVGEGQSVECQATYGPPVHW